MKLRSDGSLIFFFITIIIFIITGQQDAYDEGYAAAVEEYSGYEERHADNCDGSCDHVQNEIENLLDDDILIYRDDVFLEDDIYSEEDMDEAYWEGAYDGYIQGYGDCYYGSERELDIYKYEDEDMF